MNSFLWGSQVKMQGIFRVSAVETDPTTGAIRCLYTKPTGAVTIVTSTQAAIVKDTTGTYYSLVTPTSSEIGVWYYRWHATAGVITAGEDAFEVLTGMVST